MEDVMRDIKHFNSSNRQYIAHLAAYAYQCYGQKSKIHLDLNIAQAKKYGRYQFLFDPAKGYDNYKKILREAFASNESQTRQLFDALHAEYPQGVEIWVNNTPNKISSTPLIENSALLMLDSLLSSSSRLLSAEMELQFQIIQKYYSVSKQQEALDKARLKYIHIGDNIRREYAILKRQITNLYQRQGLSPNDAYKVVKQCVLNFHRFVVSQVTLFSLEDQAIPSQKDYQSAYKKIGILEQRQIEYFLKGQELLPEERQFNRDVFALDIEMEENSVIQKASLHYMDRHYTLTTQQRHLKQQEERFPTDDKKVYRLEATTTAHSPDYLLPNYARVEEGVYNTLIQAENPVSITVMTSRYGSPSPNEPYQQTLKLYDEHEAIYRTLLAMNQQLQAMRQQVIQSVLSPFISDPFLLRHYARLLSIEITQALHQVNMGIEKDIKQAIRKNLTIIQDFPNKDLTQAILDELLNSSLEAIINVKNTHMHLITATGAGSMHVRIAQYATQFSSQSGYCYMNMGVDSFRLDTKAFDAGWYGNNDTGLVGLYLDLQSKYPMSELDLDENIFKQYVFLLGATRKISKEYMYYVETHYIKQKLKLDQLQREIRQEQALELRLRKLEPSIDRSQLKILRQSIDKKQLELTHLNVELKKNASTLISFNNRFSEAEAKLHKEANRLSKMIYTKLDYREECIKGLAWKSYQQAMKLFHETSCGSPKWKLSANNGLFQAFIQIAAEQAGLFASGGCKSANDCELLLALGMAEFAKVIEKVDLGTDNFNEKQNPDIFEKAQKRYTYHVGQRQTALDRSGLPKLGGDILKKVDKTTLSSHRNIALLASHRRARKGKHLKESQVKELQSMGVLCSITGSWKNHTLFSENDHVAKKLKYLVFERGLTLKQKIEGYEGLLPLKMKNNQRQEVERHLLVLQAELKVKQGQAKSLDQTPEYIALTAVLNELQATLTEHADGDGKGIKALRTLMKKYNPSQMNDSMNGLIELIDESKKIAAMRHNDWTQFFARWGIGDANAKRPLWMRILYDHLAKLPVSPELLQKNGSHGMQ